MRVDDRRFVQTLFGIAASIGAFTYYEMGRRQRLAETREEKRRDWVDAQLARLSEGELGHRERSETVRSIGKIIVGAATVIVGVVALAGLFAAHTL